MFILWARSFATSLASAQESCGGWQPPWSNVGRFFKAGTQHLRCLAPVLKTTCHLCFAAALPKILRNKITTRSDVQADAG